MNTPTLELKSIQYRRTVLQIIRQANAGHTGGSLSCIDILNVLYNRYLRVSPATVNDPDRDRYVHSKGHSVEALYAVLADRGFFPSEQLNTMEKFGSDLIGHPTRRVPGIEQNTGALGHGLAVAVGMALAGKLDARPYRVYTLMGDGELAEGSVWEASMSATHYALDNLVVLIDRNSLQISGRTELVMGLEPLREKFKSFGFEVRDVNGNSIPALIQVLDMVPFRVGKPNLIMAHTTKGKGISFMEDDVAWHHRVPTDSELARANAELDRAIDAWETRYAGTDGR